MSEIARKRDWQAVRDMLSMEDWEAQRGFKNVATAVVFTWLTSEKRFHRRWLNLAASGIASNPEVRHDLDARQRLTHSIASELEHAACDELLDLPDKFLEGLGEVALQYVEWLELAEHLIDCVQHRPTSQTKNGLEPSAGRQPE